MKRIRVKYAITTPLFLGGADPYASAKGFRPPSFKGALRFWWRALAWRDAVRDAADSTAALRALHAREAKLFGVAADGRKTELGQSRVLITAKGLNTDGLQQAKDIRNSGTRYLMGQGLRDRSALRPQPLEIDITYKPETEPSDRRDVERALIALGVFGGIGGRARRGFGSLAIQSMDSIEGALACDVRIPQSRADLLPCLTTLARQLPESKPPFSAFSKWTRIGVGKPKERASSALDEAGSAMQDLRQRNRSPTRIAFGLPHKDISRSGGDFAEKTPDQIERRASPLFLHVHQFPDETPHRFAVIYLVLAARFLPSNSIVAALGGRPRAFAVLEPDASLVYEYVESVSERVEVIL